MRIRFMFHTFAALMVIVLIFSMSSGTLAQQNPVQTEAMDDEVILLIGDHQGIDEADIQTAALLIASELRKQGVSVGEPVYEVPTSATVYRVSLRRLGEKILVHLTKEIPVGTVAIERQLLIANIEGMIEAAPRLADALVHNKPIESTINMETVTETEARELKKVPTESHWGLGFFGAFVPGIDINGIPGYRIAWSYELPSYAVEVEGRIVSDANDEREAGFAAFSVGGLYFFSKRNTSPYIGGGFTASRAWWDEPHSFWETTGESEFNRGLGIYAVTGLQMLRTTQNRLKLELRVDRPLYSLENRDAMPISIGLFFSRHYVPGGAGCCLFGF